MRRTWLTTIALLAAAVPASAAPCFPDRTSIRFRDLKLDGYEVWIDDEGQERSKSGTVGTCTVARGVVQEHGIKVATVGCGSSIHLAGIRDEEGIEVGMAGRTVLRRFGELAAGIRCTGIAGKRPTVACALERSSGFVSIYHVRGRLPDRCPGVTDGQARIDRHCDAPLTGDEATAFFRSRRIVMVVDRGSCH
jgi:hypothetical protein